MDAGALELDPDVPPHRIGILGRTVFGFMGTAPGCSAGKLQQKGRVFTAIWRGPFFP